jgi:glycosyltransferase involved in cell wall biosynthesis
VTGPLVSVIIPTYNRLEYVQVAIDSVLQQTYQNYEIIVIDDGSTDGTRDLIPEKYANKVNYYYQINLGRSSARNIGASLAKGEYLAFLDSDDIWAPDKLFEQVKYMVKDNNHTMALVCCNVLMIDLSGKLISNQVVGHYYGMEKYKLEKFFYSPVIFAFPSNVLLRKSCFENVGGFDHQLDYGEDWDLLIRLRARWKFGHVTKPLLFYRTRDKLQGELPETDKIDFQLEQKLMVLRKSYSLLTDKAVDRVTHNIEARNYERCAFQYFARGCWDAGLTRLLKASTYDGRCIENKLRIIQNIGLWGVISGVSLFGYQDDRIVEYFFSQFFPKIIKLWPSGVVNEKAFPQKTFGAFYHNLASQLDIDNERISRHALSALTFDPLRYVRSPGNWNFIIKRILYNRGISNKRRINYIEIKKWSGDRQLHERSQSSRKRMKTKIRLQYFIDRIKAVIKSGLEKVPYIGPFAIRLWQKTNAIFGTQMLRLANWRFRYLNRSSPLTEDEINATVYVSPQDIVYETLVEYSFEDGKGLVLGGNWDRLEKRFEDLDVYVAFREVIKEKKRWDETVFYQRVVSKLESGETLWECANKRDFDNRCAQFSELIENIKKNGYKSQTELNTGNIDDEIIVNIGRYGDILFSNSAHRLAIAKIIGIEKVPGKIAVRHAEWMRFRTQYANLAVERDMKAYQPALHPDLQHIPAHHDCVDRFEIIKKNLSFKQGRLLDLGANLGYFCSRFEDEGFKCVAVENNPKYSYYLKGLRRATNKHFRIVDESILDSKEILNEPYDIVLALNIFHHFLKSKESFGKFKFFLEHLRCQEIYFEPHLYDEPQMENAYKNMNSEEFVEYILQKTRLSKSVLLGRAADGRPLYKLS